jgi:tripartite-type tricarboxylate transporter receptor subunit TctC
MDRRHFLGALAALGLASPTAGWTQATPVRVLVGFPPGTAADVAVRAVTEPMARALGRPFVIDNRPGAGSNIAARLVAAAPADGQTLFAITIANCINAAFPGTNAVDPTRDFAPITRIGNVPNILVVHPSLKVNSVRELVALAKAKPGTLLFASSGVGTSPHLSGELFAHMAGVKMVHVPYRGSTPAVTDLLGGQVHLMFSPASTVVPHLASGRLKALAVTSRKRTPIAPELPTLDESGLKGFDTSVWVGLVAPARTPAAVTQALRGAAHAALASTAVKAAFFAQGIDPVQDSELEFARFLQGESARWKSFVQATGLKPE